MITTGICCSQNDNSLLSVIMATVSKIPDAPDISYHYYIKSTGRGQSLYNCHHILKWIIDQVLHFL